MPKMSRRTLLGAPIWIAAAQSVAAEPQTGRAPITNGPFSPTADSLSTYQVPDWFRDAKFGIWAHWGPQAVPRSGDWYARQMYVPGHRHYAHHLEHYGHPSEFGYKDIIPLWTAEKFDPDALMSRYVAAGSKYFVSMGVHHDNFDLWNSRHHRWNAAAMGPKRDIVGAWRDAARKRGLRFGVSEHLGASHNWWYPSHGYDQFWPKMGIDYDGANPQYADLYHKPHNEPYKGSALTWYTNDPDYHRIWFDRIRDLLDSYDPDLLYSDGGLPFGDVGRALLAHFYNQSVSRHRTLQAVYTCKNTPPAGEFLAAACVQDVERGVMSDGSARPWQTDTSNGDWFYKEDDKYKTGPDVIRMLADIVSKNGNLLLNVVLNPDGSLPDPSQMLLDDLRDWMKVNAEAIHGTRPWKIFGEGPTQVAGGAFKESAAYTPDDIRFTTRKDTVYAITLGEPRGRVTIASLGRSAAHGRAPVRRVRLLGVPHALKFRQSDSALEVEVPERLPTRHASVLAVT